jgi:hypothetical protein
MSIFAYLNDYKTALGMHIANWYFIDGIYYVKWPSHIGFHINGCVAYVDRILLSSVSPDIIIASIFEPSCVLTLDICHFIYGKLNYDVHVNGAVYVTKTAKINSSVIASAIICLNGVKADVLDKCHSTRLYIEHGTLNKIIHECLSGGKVMSARGTICISGGTGIIDAKLIRAVFPDIRDFSDEPINWKKTYKTVELAGLAQ